MNSIIVGFVELFHSRVILYLQIYADIFYKIPPHQQQYYWWPPFLLFNQSKTQKAQTFPRQVNVQHTWLFWSILTTLRALNQYYIIIDVVTVTLEMCYTKNVTFWARVSTLNFTFFRCSVCQKDFVYVSFLHKVSLVSSCISGWRFTCSGLLLLNLLSNYV